MYKEYLLGLGRMDSTSAYGEYFDLLTPLDLQAFDGVGWDVVASTPVIPHCVLAIPSDQCFNTVQSNSPLRFMQKQLKK